MSKLSIDFIKNMYHTENQQILRLEEIKQQVVLNLKKEFCPNKTTYENILDTIQKSISEIKEYVEKYRWMILAIDPNYEFEIK